MLVWMAACALVQGCKPNAPAATSAGDGGVGATPLTGKPIRIAMIAKSSTNPVFLSARRGAETAAKDLSNRIGAPIELIWLTPPQEDGQIGPAHRAGGQRGRERDPDLLL